MRLAAKTLRTLFASPLWGGRKTLSEAKMFFGWGAVLGVEVGPPPENRFAIFDLPRKGRSFVVVALSALVLSGCGFHPLYGGANGAMSATLSTIYVEPVPDRLGYELRNQLIDLLDGPGTATGATYRLTLALSETTQGIALQNDATITRYNDTLKVSYTLTDRAGKTVTSGTETGLSAYNVLPSGPQANYGTLAAQQDAEKRAAQDIAERIRLDLNVYFAKR
ncbi:MAG TPA: LPS assembly lipoprotein LptE [Casimicrobiaceae bacterium]